MRRKSILQISVVTVLAIVLALLGIVQAQDNGTPALGVSITNVDGSAYITQVYPDSPAEAAGLQHGDIITAIDGEAVTFDSLAPTIRSYGVGDTITLTVVRNNEELDIDVTLETFSLPQVQAAPPRMPNFPNIQDLPNMFFSGRPLLGVRLEPTDEGFIVREVTEGSPAEAAGLQPDDIITYVNGDSVNDINLLREVIMDAAMGDGVLELEVLRDGETLTLEADLSDALPFGNFGDGVLEFNLGNGGVSLAFDGENITVEQLDEDSPLYEAGLREGDVITAINGEPIDSGMGLQFFRNRDEEEITLTVERGDETLDLTIPHDDLMPFALFDFGHGFGDGAGMLPFDFSYRRQPVKLGVRYVMLTEDNAADYDVELTEGAYIAEVLADTPAKEAGLQEGDVITAVNGDAVDNEHPLGDLLADFGAGDTVTLTVQRDGETMDVDVTLADIASTGSFGEFFGLPRGFGFRFGPDGFNFFGPDGDIIPLETPEANQQPEL